MKQKYMTKNEYPKLNNKYLVDKIVIISYTNELVGYQTLQNVSNSQSQHEITEWIIHEGISIGNIL